MPDLKFAIFGTGFWSHYQIPAWFEVGGVAITALYNRTGAKAERVAEKFNLQLAQLKQKTNAHNISFPRQVAMYLVKELTSASLPTE